MARRVRGRLNFDVVNFTKEPTVGQRGDGEITGRVAQREVYGSDESLGAADVTNSACLREGFSQGLLDQRRGTIGEMRQDGDGLRSRDGDIENFNARSEAHGLRERDE